MKTTELKNNMTIDEMIAVLQAYKEGRKIECSDRGRDNWFCAENPVWNFRDCNYRIKPEPRYHPFESAEEAMEAIKEHGSYVQHKMGKSAYYLITQVKDTGVIIKNETSTTYYDIMKNNFIFSDGAPFGKLVEE